jgi:hypothetical protein
VHTPVPPMSAFFDPASVPRPDPARHAGTPWSGQATFTGRLCVVGQPRDVVAALLPPALVLMPDACADPTQHPLLFAFGEQSDGTLIVGGRPLSLGIRYGEFALLIPFVRHRQAVTPHVFVARMCSAYFPATWHGNAHYGFAKTTARMRTDGPLFVMSDDDDRLLLHAATEARGPWEPATAAAHPNLDAVRRLFAHLPVLGRRTDGSVLCSRFAWDFDDADVRLASGWVSIDGPLVDTLAPRLCPAVPGGAFEVRGMRWRLSWPGRCV